MATNVFNLIILDESGSMSCISKQALTGVNETLQTIRSAAKEYDQQKVSLLTFDSNHLRYVYDCVDAAEAHDITEKDYQPNACTPLYDAMGQGLQHLRRQCNEKEDKVLVTIITDGMENASREYRGSTIKALVQELRQLGWAFTYIGSNQDVDAVADDLGIKARMTFEEDAEGTQAMFMRENRSRARFYRNLNAYGASQSADELAANYFAEDDE